MRILLLAPMLPRADGGGAIPNLLHTELVALSEHHEVTYVTAVGDEPGEAEAAAELVRSGRDIHLADRSQPPSGLARWRRRWRLARTWARGRWPWRTVWFADPAVQEVLDRLTRWRAFDLVAVEDSSMSVFELPPGVPCVLTEHEVRTPRPVQWRPGPPPAWPRWAIGELDWRRWKRFQQQSWRRFDRVQVFSQRDAAAVAKLAPDVAPRIRVNQFGLVLPAPPNPERELPGTVLFVGNFTHAPNRDAAIWLAHEIMPAVRARYPRARLRLVGTAPTRDVLNLVGDGVEVFPDAPTVQPHLEAAAVVLAPVRIGGGMRMKVLEALASGKALVTTSRGADGYAAQDEPLPFVVADDAESIATAAAGLLADPAERRELGRRGRAFAERHHSPAAWASRLETVYAEVLR